MASGLYSEPSAAAATVPAPSLLEAPEKPASPNIAPAATVKERWRNQKESRDAEHLVFFFRTILMQCGVGDSYFVVLFLVSFPLHLTSCRMTRFKQLLCHEIYLHMQGMI